jgi:hypothetical protein
MIPDPPAPSYYLVVLQHLDGEDEEYKSPGYSVNDGVIHFGDLSGGMYFYALNRLAGALVVPIHKGTDLTFDQLEAFGLDGSGRS